MKLLSSSSDSTYYDAQQSELDLLYLNGEIKYCVPKTCLLMNQKYEKVCHIRESSKTEN